jgi:hypothetical protein
MVVVSAATLAADVHDHQTVRPQMRKNYRWSCVILKLLICLRHGLEREAESPGIFADSRPRGGNLGFHRLKSSCSFSSSLFLNLNLT